MDPKNTAVAAFIIYCRNRWGTFLAHLSSVDDSDLQEQKLFHSTMWGRQNRVYRKLEEL